MSGYSACPFAAQLNMPMALELVAELQDHFCLGD